VQSHNLETGPKPSCHGDHENPEPKPQPACLFAVLHQKIITSTLQANQGEIYSYLRLDS
jgi:hypothetical protein